MDAFEAALADRTPDSTLSVTTSEGVLPVPGSPRTSKSLRLTRLGTTLPPSLSPLGAWRLAIVAVDSGWNVLLGSTEAIRNDCLPGPMENGRQPSADIRSPVYSLYGRLAPTV